ncbi:MAG: TetR/AcrR family transcriptional repressor of nem operon, partial [Myxococcota bacterium]
RILSAAETLMKQQGFSGFSYADVAARVGIRKASIHHHFPTKTDLAVASLQDYRAGLVAELAPPSVDVDAALSRFEAIFVAALEGPGGGCLCGTLASDWVALPEPVQDEVQGYWQDACGWLARQFERHTPMSADTAATEALVAFSMFEGALMTAKVLGTSTHLGTAFSAARERLQSLGDASA